MQFLFNINFHLHTDYHTVNCPVHKCSVMDSQDDHRWNLSFWRDSLDDSTIITSLSLTPIPKYKITFRKTELNRLFHFIYILLEICLIIYLGFLHDISFGGRINGRGTFLHFRCTVNRHSGIIVNMFLFFNWNLQVLRYKMIFSVNSGYFEGKAYLESKMHVL